MILSSEEKMVLEGKRGPLKKKILQTIVEYGRALDAERLVDIEGNGHFVISSAVPGFGPRIEILRQLVQAGFKTKMPFTLDPQLPKKLEELDVTPEKTEVFRQMLKDQPLYDQLMLQLGLEEPDAYTCTPYLPEIGNIPERDQIVAWSESSCVIYANSVLGARTNRNAAIIDLFSNIIGKTPLTGLLTDKGRLASKKVMLKSNRLPDPQLLGAAIGRAVMEEVPYIIGLDSFLGSELNPTTMDYLKEMGATCASLGAVGLFHVENITPEAIDYGPELIRDDAQTLIVDAKHLENLLNDYHRLWADQSIKHKRCFIGCPHLSLKQLYWWAENISIELKKRRRSKVALDTFLCAAPKVIRRFQEHNGICEEMRKLGVRVSPLCAEAYMNNPLCAAESVLTNSLKLQAFTAAKMLPNRVLLMHIVGDPVRQGK